MKEPNEVQPSRQPVVAADQHLPEITFKAIVLGVILAVVLAAANAYLGLFAGMTVSASIPAAVISMTLFSFFRRSNILENNIVQTAASAGEAVAAAAVFTIPGLVILGFWKDYDYVQTLLICALGGTIGVLFSVPLRRALVVQSEKEIKFPEGIATGEVLKAGQRGEKGNLSVIVAAGLTGGILKLCQEAGLKLWSSALELGGRVGGSVAYLGMDLSPALLGVGFIVGLRIAVLVFLGGALSWWIAIPLYAALHGLPDGGTAVASATSLWRDQIRFLGVGAMCVGGFWALIQMRHQLLTGVRSGLQAFRDEKAGSAVDRTDRDIPMVWVLVFSALSVIPLFFVYRLVVESTAVSLVMAVIMLVAGFLFSAVAGYMAGLVGSSNNPISGVTISTILFASLVLLLFMGHGNPSGPAAAILIGAVVCCAASISGDNLQDLKAGYIVGATPWKQEFMLIVGVLSSAFVIAPILQLLNLKYGVGVPMDADAAWMAAHPTPLPAPQATLMASVSKGVFMGGLPWTMVAIGACIAVAIISLDLYLKARGSAFRTPVLAVAVGIYLPFRLSTTILVGGLVAYAVSRAAEALGKSGLEDATRKTAEAAGEKRGLLFASGLITGEALMGILLAVPITLASFYPSLGGDFLALFREPPLGAWPGVIAQACVIAALYSVVALALRRASRER
ncbi:MAG: oligopeptide transporter, OPT family [Acidobacteriota bacterium]